MISNCFYLGDGRGVLISTEGEKRKTDCPFENNFPARIAYLSFVAPVNFQLPWAIFSSVYRLRGSEILIWRKSCVMLVDYDAWQHVGCLPLSEPPPNSFMCSRDLSSGDGI
jgi:hypothetical protein